MKLSDLILEIKNTRNKKRLTNLSEPFIKQLETTYADSFTAAAQIITPNAILLTKSAKL